ncbi:MAG TPA: penicillin-binding protein 2 [Terriglobales bacterium]|nr:penicillin-binding protein 2 [Terriglobales bacterium]
MYDRDDKIPGIKLAAIQYVILLVIAILVVRLWNLQVSGSEKYESLAEQNRIRKVPILAPRGKIYDREGRLIVDNYPSVSALLIREQLPKNDDADLKKIAAGLHMTEDEIRDRMKRLGSAQNTPFLLKDDITPDDQAFIEAHRDELPELETIMAYRRLYPENGFLAHLIGYVGEVSDADLNTPQFELYQPGAIVGKSGVEEFYNDLLIGKDGSRRAIVNSHGKEVGRLSTDPAVPGKSLKLTIDLDIQKAAEETMDGRNGAIVAMDPHTGEILAMVSRPTFDPNMFSVRISNKDWNALITDPEKPLLNKAIQAQLAPGSTFKIIMSFAGIQEGIAQNMVVHCSGSAVFYGHRFGCWVPSGHGNVDLAQAITHSCDVFFYTLAEKLGIDTIAKYAHEVGLGQRTGIDLPQEASGTVPSEEWKAKLFHQKWFAGETISVGIGQGALAVTPIQLARAIAAITSDGRMVRPHVAFPDNLPPQLEQVALNDRQVENLNINSQGWITITNAMAEVLNPGGTAPSAHLDGIDFAGKTGSAQVITLAHRKALGAKGNEFKQNGWFVGVTPRRNPDLVVVVLFQSGEHGRLAARLGAPIVKAFVEKQRRVRHDNNYASVDKQGHPIELSGIWTDGKAEDGVSDRIDGGTFLIATDKTAAKRVNSESILGRMPAVVAAGAPVSRAVN